MKHSSVVCDDWQPLPMDAEALAYSSYIARKPCGCFAACMALPDRPKRGDKCDAESRKVIADWLKDGYIIDRVPDQWNQWIGDNGFQRCEAYKSPPEQQRMEL